MDGSRDHILNTSLKLFQQKGFKEVTMKDLVKAAGLSTGAFYHYFNSKEALFAEVIRHFFEELMITDYAKMPNASLKDFYTGVLKASEFSQKQLADRDGARQSANHFYLIFDALRILPDFREKYQKGQKEELKAWMNIVRTAKARKEIQTRMSDEEIARLFIYLGDGTNINLLAADMVHKQVSQLKKQWDNLYNMLAV